MKVSEIQHPWCSCNCYTWLLNTALKGEKDGVMITKPGHLMTGNT